MDDDELLTEWGEFVAMYGSAEAGALSVQVDAEWSEIEWSELEELLQGFADTYSPAEAARVSALIMGGGDF